MPLGGFAFPAPEPPALLLRPGEGPHLQQYKGPVPARHRPGTALTPRENADRDGGFDPKTRDYLGEDGTDYFEGIDLDDEAGLRTRYRQLAQKSHPDMGGSNRAMADINRQYGMRKSYLDGRAAGAKAAAGAPAYGWDEAASSADPRGGSGTDLMLPGGRWPVQPNVVPTGPSLSGMGGMGAVTGGPQTTSPTGMLPATQADGTGDAGKSTTIDTDPATHTPEQMATIRAYQAAADKNILAFIERWHKLKDPNYRRKVRISIASVNQRTVMDVKAVTGVDTSDFTGHSLSGNALEHTALRHGVNGKADHSMADPNDIARMGYVLEHYDSVEALLTKDGKPILSGEYYNADGSRAPLVRFAKRVNGTYYVVEAVPDAAIREFRVVTAYMQKGSDSTSQELDVPKSGPQPTSKTGLDAHTIASGISIPQPPSVVNPGSTADTPSGRVALLSRAAQSSFGPMGQMALSGVYDQDMAARLDPDAAHLVFAKVYNAVLQGQPVPKLSGVPQTLIDAAAAGARSDLRLSQYGGAEASSNQGDGRAAMDEAGEESQTFGKVAAEPAETQQQAVEVTNREPGFDYNDGRTQRFAAALPSETEERMDAVVRDLGLTIRAVDSVFDGRANAQIVGNEILIDENVTTDGVAYILGHEFTHRVKELAETEYFAFQAVLDQGNLRDTAAKIADIYRAKGVELTEAHALDEATANMAGEMLQNGVILDDFIARNRGNKTLLQKVRDWFRGIIAKLQGGEKRQGQIAVEKLTAALNAAERNVQLAESVQAGTETQYSIGYDVNNTPFVTVENDILDGVPRSEWVRTVKENLREKFPKGVTVGQSTIRIDRQSRKEMTFSRYTRYLMESIPELYADKLRATNNADEILQAARNYVNEALAHPRKDNIQDFARGEVQLRVGGHDYTAQVVVAMRSNGNLILYDVLQLAPTTIQEKSLAQR